MSDPAPALNATLTPSLHPHLLLSPSPHKPCTLHLALHLPDALFPDPDELVDLWGPASSPPSSPPNPTSEPDWSVAATPLWWRLSPPVIDIERPELPALPALSIKAAPTGAPRVLLELRVRGALDVPLHARYLIPDPDLPSSPAAALRSLAGAFARDAYRDVDVFDGVRGRIEAAWDCGQQEPLRAVDVRAVARLPVGDTAYRLPVEVVTAAVVWAGWAWVLLAIVRAARGASKVKTA